MRLFFATDIHGSDICFKKFLRAAEVYRADALFLGGDYTNKSIVVATHWRNAWVAATSGTTKLEFDTRKELEVFLLSCRRRGALTRELSNEDFFAAQNDERFVNALYELALRDLVHRWTGWAEKALITSGIPIYQIPGNDEPLLCDEFFRSCPFVPVDRQHFPIGDDLAIVGLGGSNLTPWHTPREYHENEIDNMIQSVLDSKKSDAALIFFMHVPPYESGLDEAPKLNQNLSYSLVLGAPITVPIGSHAIRRAVESVQPLLGLFGHAHESRGHVRIGNTLCINPGSAFEDGRLLGCIITINDAKITNFQLTEG